MPIFLTRSKLQSLLLALSGPTAVWPRDEELHTVWMEQPAYERLRPQRTIMVLEALERRLYGSKQEYQQPPAGTYTVEHLMPQNPTSEAWPLPTPAEASEEAQIATQLQRIVLQHTFGNLTLVTGSLNSALSNGPWVAKQAALTNNSQLMLNKYFYKHNVTTWDEAAIRQRGEHLFALALRVWPRPETGL